MAEDIGVAQEFVTTVVDLSTATSQVVTAGPCVVRGTSVNTLMSAHTAALNDSAGVEKAVIPASSPVGYEKNHYDTTMNGITVASNASGTGEIAIVWKPFSTPLQFTPQG
mgnify:CR=1 FL=1